MIACVAGKEEREERDAGLSIARHVHAYERYVSELYGEMLREERAGVVPYLHVQTIFNLLGINLEHSKSFATFAGCPQTDQTRSVLFEGKSCIFWSWA